MKRNHTIMPRMSMRWYAVQIGNDYASDWGSVHKHEAFEMARDAAEENPGEEVRISFCKAYPDDNFCDGVIIVQEATC